MSERLQGLLWRLAPIVYVQLSPQRLAVRNARTGQAISEPPEVAIAHGKPARMVAAGAQARAAALTTSGEMEVVNPFAHPRSLVSDFTVGEQLLRVFMRRLLPRSWLRPAPIVVMHPLGEPEGGFTQVEIRAFRELALGMGASQAIVWEGAPLTDQELLAGRFPATGRVLS